MRRIITAFILLVHTFLLQAQQKPHYTQYFQNMSVLNPAVTGMYKSISINAGLRNQWTGLESAPKTSYFTASMPLNIGSSASGFVDNGITEPGTRVERDDYLSSYSHHGVGVVLLRDKTGPLSRNTINLTYAYHLNMADKANLSVGVGVGANQVALNIDQLIFENPADPAIASGGSLKKVTPDLNAGFYLYGASFYVGGTVQQALNSTLSFNSGYTTGKEQRHYFLTTGFRVWMNEDFSFSPSIMYKNIRPLPASYDVNLKVAYRNEFWIAGSYRKKDAATAMLGFNIENSVSLGYAYDYTTSKLKKASSGSHELVFGLHF